MEEDDFLVPFADGDVAVDYCVPGIGEIGEFMVVGCEEGAAFDFVVEVLGN